jgi:excinuclease ABC subunit C
MILKEQYIIYKSMHLSSLKSKTQKLPKSPGVYIFKDKAGKIIYIGKATNLRSRVSSYFSTPNADKGFDQTSRFNLGIAKGYLKIEPFERRVEPRGARPIDFAIDQIADIEVRETDSVLDALILESHLIKKLQPKYNAMGKDDKSFSYFVVTKEEFPRVLIVRATDIAQISNFQFLISKKITNSKIQIKKTYGPYASKKQMEVALKIVRRIFPFHSINAKSEKGDLDFQLGLCPGPYAGAITRVDYLKNIRGIRMILEGKKKNLVKKLEKEMIECAARHEFEKAADIRNKIFSLKHIRDVALLNRDENFQFPISNFQTNSIRHGGQNSKFLRIEAYDISNISGQHAVGSMVVFKNGEPDKSQYRKFKIKTVSGADDVGMMKEILLRRFKNDWTMPDLILLDGGAGHFNMAEKLISDLGLVVAVVAVAKGPTRKNLEFRISNFESNPNIKNILKDKKLIKQIMDEAHRFAISYHRKLRKKNLLS